MNEPKEQILKNIVYEINEFIKKTRKITQQKNTFNFSDLITNPLCQYLDSKNNLKCDGFYLKFENKLVAPTQYECKCVSLNKKFKDLNSTNISIHKIGAHWPLKKGMVDTKFLAWQSVPSANEGIQYSVAFMIKCISVSIYNNHKSKNDINSIDDDLSKNVDTKHLFYFDKLISNKDCSLLFWNEVKKYYIQDFNHEQQEKKLRPHFYHQILPKKKLIVLCFEESFFRLRSGTNFELFAFEQFINDMINSDNGMIVFSTQKLLPDQITTNSFITDYSLSFKKSLDEKKVSIQQAMEPDYKIASDKRFIEPNKIGAFDRLIELLAKGQNFIDSLEKDFLEWKIKIEN